MQIEESRKLQLEIGRGIQEQLEVRDENFHFSFSMVQFFLKFENVMIIKS